jgi:hypothetical protein
MKNMKNMKKNKLSRTKQIHFSNFIKTGLTILISVLIVCGVVQAGSITPPSGTPSAQFYTLSEIYEFITNNTAATEGGHDFTFSDSLAGTGRTLTEVYNALAGLISADTVKLGATYLNVAGTLVPSGGDAATADVLNNKTFFGDSQADWNLQAGTMTNNGNFGLTCGVSDSLVTTGYYSGGTLVGDADLISANIRSTVNIFGIDGNGNVVDTSSGDAVAGDMLSGKKAWVDGSEITGNITTQTLSADNETVNAGYYNATTLSAVDGDLVTNNIKSGITIFGIDGNGNVVDTSTGDAVVGEVLSGKKAWVDGIEITGSMSDKEGDNASTAQTATGGVNYFIAPTGFYDGDDRVSATDAEVAALDSDIATGNIKSGAEIFGFSGNSNVVDTSSGDAVAGDIASTKKVWVDGAEVTGSFDPYTPQWLQTKDDWVNSGGTTGEYTSEEATWITVSGSPFSGYDAINYSSDYDTIDLYSGEVKMDERAGLWWSDIAAIDGGGTATTTSNSFTLTADGSRPTGGHAIGFCDALNTANFAAHNDWYLPTQKELQQAYIDGSANNLSRPTYYFWSSTELSWDSTTAWRVSLDSGYTTN